MTGVAGAVNRAHFFATTARMMRRVLVALRAHDRRPSAVKALKSMSLEAAEVAAPTPGVDVVALNDALAELAALDQRPSHVVELRFFGGFSVEETAETCATPERRSPARSASSTRR